MDTKTHKLLVRLTELEWRLVSGAAAVRGRSVSELTAELVREHLARLNGTLSELAGPGAALPGQITVDEALATAPPERKATARRRGRKAA